MQHTLAPFMSADEPGAPDIGYDICPECDNVFQVERVHNGVCYVYHGIHCGWGRDSGSAYTERPIPVK